jgi:predicted acylesterase/phospholipase RssA
MTKREHTILVLQGGGVLGTYQARVYEGIAETRPVSSQEPALCKSSEFS